MLPFTGLNTPLAVTVDSAGKVYVADRGNDRVVKLAPDERRAVDAEKCVVVLARRRRGIGDHGARNSSSAPACGSP